MKNEDYISINKIAEIKGLTGTRSLRLEINKPDSKYISRSVKVNGGTSYEILFESLEPDIQQKIRENETKSVALVPLNYQPPMHYRSDVILGLRDKVYVRYSLFDLSKIYVYSTNGEFLCVAHRVQKIHPMANVLGTVKDMEEYKQAYQKQQKLKSKLIKQVKKTFVKEEIEVLEIERETEETIQIEEQKSKREHKLRRQAEAGEACDEQDSKCCLMRAPKKTPREQQMNRPFFSSKL